MLTADDKAQLDQVATGLTSARGYILALTGGTDSVGDAQYNYQLSNRRADAVVNYLSVKYNIPPHKFYLIVIGARIVRWRTTTPVRDEQENRRVENQAAVEHGA